VAFAPNTHEFVLRLFSCLPRDRPARVLASAHEVHSFRRQAHRLQEAGAIELQEIAAEPWATFPERFAAAARAGPWDLIWLSHVFFDSGYVVQDLDGIVAAAPADAIVAIDGYHAFCAIPVDLSGIHRRAFYLAGGYKYAMSGEGCCFLAIPPGCALRPVSTGWFASFGELSEGQRDVTYADDAFRFWGATFDPSGLYRFDAAMTWLAATGVSIAQLHAHSLAMQERFLEGLGRIGSPRLGAAHLVPPERVARGNFLAFDVDDAEGLHATITATGVVIDRRGRRLRFGFGVYHDAAAIDRLLATLQGALEARAA
jgi:selenocysteine lyase/cysteine desulfurase